MRTDIVLTVTGPDRVGIVEEVTGTLLDLDGNVEASRMARLGGEFAILSLVALPEDRVESVASAFEGLVARGYRVTAGPAQPEADVSHEGWPAFHIRVEGADHEGIIHEIAAGLAGRGITIESAETSTSAASLSGTPLFSMAATVLVPPELPEGEWRDDLGHAADRSNVDVTVTPAVGGAR
jgi:glycine cleavage system transcriptional repressor